MIVLVLYKRVQRLPKRLSHCNILQLCSDIPREKKRDAWLSVYYSKMKSIADEMAAAGKKLDDDDIIG